VMWLIDQIMWKSFDRRLATFLINEANIERTDKLIITHEVIGNHLGSPREVVTRMLKYFVNEGLIALSRGTIEIIDSDGLSTIAEG
ncbi:MAG: Crp/Fnr family transcriptional regulator, partial [Candidatus Scatosoma sp.]